jgi:hypothetical protein
MTRFRAAAALWLAGGALLCGCDYFRGEFVYLGSDVKYHYFYDGEQSYRVLRQNLDVDDETPIDQVRAGKKWDGRAASRSELEQRILDRAIERYED